MDEELEFSISKFPSALGYYQDIETNIKTLINNIETTEYPTKFTFTILKCNHLNGVGWIEISGFEDVLILSFVPPTFQYTQNNVSQIFYKIFISETSQLSVVSCQLWEKLAKLNYEHIAYCASIVLFENIKNDKVDCCFCINVELSHDDRVSILNYKLKNITEITEKVKIDEQKMVKRGNFKPGCCDCNLF